MAEKLLEIGVTNAMVALVLAAIVFAVSRYLRNSHWLDLLWTVVLIAFLAPPLFVFKVPVAKDTTLARIDATPESNPVSGGIQTTASNSAPKRDAAVTSPEPTSTRGHKSSSNNTRPDSVANSASPASSPTSDRTPTDHREYLSSLFSLSNLGLIWLVGSLVAAAMLLTSGFRFHRLIRTNQAVAQNEWNKNYGHLLDELGMGQAPLLRLVNLDIPPMIWTWIGQTSIVVPVSLAKNLSADEQKLLLAHELAHVDRRDHWVRWLEAVVHLIYWWVLPIRSIRNQLHAAQESCCDAWVDRRLPDHRLDYSNLLLQVATRFNQKGSRPAFAVPFARQSNLKSRTQRILDGTFSRPPNRIAWSFCLVAGLLVAAVSVRTVASSRLVETQDRQQPEHSAEIFVNDENGEVIQAGSVRVRANLRDGGYFEETVTINDGSGSFTLASNELERIRFIVEAPYYQKYLREFVREKARSHLSLEPEYRFTLILGQTIGGKVVDENGNPIRDAEIYAYVVPDAPIEQGGHGFGQRTITDENGLWEMTGAPKELIRLAIAVSHKDYLSNPEFAQAVVEEEDDLAKFVDKTDVRILQPAPTLSGKVVDPDGNPVEGAMMLLSRQDFYADYGAGRIPVTNEEGQFHFPNVPAGKYQLTVFSLDWCLKTIPVAIPISDPLQIDVRKGHRVEFRAVDQDGLPIEGVSIRPEGPPTVEALKNEHNYGYVLDFLNNRDLLKNRTDANGVFVWENAPTEDLSYMIFSPETLAIYDQVYGPAGSPHEIVMRPKIEITGAVVDDESGAPIEAFRLFTGTHFHANRAENWSWNEVRGKEIQSGRFDVQLHATERDYRYRVQAEGYFPILSETFDAQTLPDTPISLEFRLKKDSGFSGTIRTAAGAIASGANIYTKVGERHTGRGVLSVVDGDVDEATATHVIRVDGEGSFQVPVHHDPFACLIVHESGYAELMDVDLFAKKEISLTPWASFQGRVRIQGNAAPDVGISLMNGAPFLQEDFPRIVYSHSLTTDASGAYNIDKLSAGVWDQRIVFKAAPERHNVRTRIQLDQATSLTQEFGGQSTVDLVGQIDTGENDQVDWEKSYVSIHQLQSLAESETHSIDGIWQSRRMGPDGHFRFYNLNKAEQTLNVAIYYLGERGPRHKWSLTIPADQFVDKSTQDPLDLQVLSSPDK